MADPTYEILSEDNLQQMAKKALRERETSVFLADLQAEIIVGNPGLPQDKQDEAEITLVAALHALERARAKYKPLLAKSEEVKPMPEEGQV